MKKIILPTNRMCATPWSDGYRRRPTPTLPDSTCESVNCERCLRMCAARVTLSDTWDMIDGGYSSSLYFLSWHSSQLLLCIITRLSPLPILAGCSITLSTRLLVSIRRRLHARSRCLCLLVRTCVRILLIRFSALPFFASLIPSQCLSRARKKYVLFNH